MKTLLLLTWLFLLLVIVSSAGIYYVQPDNSECPGIFCLTFDEYVEEADIYFRTNSTFIFLAGNHTLKTALHLSRVSNVLLTGSGETPNTDIVCKLTYNINLTVVFNITLKGMTFLLFNKYDDDRESALFIDSSFGVTISNMIFLGSRDVNSPPLAHAVYCTASNITVANSLFEAGTGNRAIHAT